MGAFCALLALAIAPHASRAQGVWHVHEPNTQAGTEYGSQQGLASVLDGQGNVIVAGSPRNASFSGLRLVKYDPSGHKIQTIDNSAVHYALQNLAIDDAGNCYALCGHGLLLKYAPDGTLLYQTQLQYPDGGGTSGLAVDPGGAAYAFGYYTAYDSQQQAYTALFLAKVGPDGTLDWTRSYLGDQTGSRLIDAAALDGDGDVILTGYTDSGQSDVIPVLLKYDSSGDLLFERLPQAVTPIDGAGQSLAIDSAGDIYVGGNATYTAPYSGMFLAKYSADGTKQWERRYSNNVFGEYDYVSQIAFDSSGSVLAAGGTSDSQSNTYRTLLKYDPDGALTWARRADKAATQHSSVIGLYPKADNDNFYTVESETAYDSTTDTRKDTIVTTLCGPNGRAISEQDYIGSPHHLYDVILGSSVYDPRSDSLYFASLANYSPESGRYSDYEWVTIKDQFGQ